MLRGNCFAAWLKVSFIMGACWCGGPTEAVQAQDPVQVTRIVEEWELTLNAPDSSTTAPQITLAFSPHRHLNSHYATLELNHQATPQFAAGGVHFHAWNGAQCLGSRHQGGSATLNTSGEVIRWQHVLNLSEGSLELSIAEGTSTTWNAFGNEDNLKFAIPTSLTNLNCYSPDYSVSQSGVGFAGGRVKRLAIVKLTAYSSLGLVAESTKLRIAHETK